MSGGPVITEKASFFSRKKNPVIGRETEDSWPPAGRVIRKMASTPFEGVSCMLYAVFTSATFLFRECPMEPAGEKGKLQTGIPDF